MQPVFLSYSRKSSASAARALHAALPGECFLDESAIEAGDRFSERLADALLASRVVVVFASPEYFQRRTCLWELRAALGPYDLSPDPRQLEHLVVVLPPEGAPEELERLPPGLQAGNWLTTANPDGVARLVRSRMVRPGPTLGARYEALGQPVSAVRARLLELTARPPATTLAGVSTVYGLVEVPLHDDFVGRWDELHRADFWLRTACAGPGAAAPTVSVEGLGGLGKTRLAAEYVYRFGARAFPGGILWFDAGKPLEPQYHGALRALDPTVPAPKTFTPEAGDSRPALEAALRARSASQPILVVVDNVPESGEGGAAPRSLGEYCPAVGHVATLVTSRRRLSLEPGRRGLLLRELDPRSAVQLLARGVPPGQLSPEEWMAIASWVGCLPLALTLLNQVLLSGQSAQALLEAARGGGVTETLDGQMEALRAEVEPGSLRGVTEALSISYRKLLPAAQVAARLLAFLAPAPIPLALVERMPELFTLQVRSQLLRRCFVTPHELSTPSVPMFGSMHRITADYLRTCEPAPEAQERAGAALREILEGEANGPGDSWHLWQACVEHAAHYLRLTGERDLPLQLAVSGALLQLGRRLEALETAQRSVEACRRASATGVEARPRLALALAVLRDCLRELGRWDEDLRALQELVDVHRALAAGHPDEYEPRLAGSLGALSAWLSARGRCEEALRASEGVVEVRRRLANGSAASALDLATSLSVLCNCLAELKRWGEARAALEEAAEVWGRLAASPGAESTPGLAVTLSLLESCHRRVSGHVPLDEASPTLPNALAVFGQGVPVRPGGETNTHACLTPVRYPSAPPIFALLLVQGPGAPRLFSLAREEIVLGRSVEADIQIDATDLSRKHLSLHRQDGEYRILDLGSRNGVHLNGVRIHSAVLRHGDNVQLGATVLIYRESHYWGD